MVVAYLDVWLGEAVGAVDVGAPDDEHGGVTGLQRPGMVASWRVEPPRARPRAPRPPPHSGIGSAPRIPNIPQFTKLDSNIGADFSIVLYEGDVWTSLKKEIVAIRIPIIILRPAAFRT